MIHHKLLTCTFLKTRQQSPVLSPHSQLAITCPGTSQSLSNHLSCHLSHLAFTCHLTVT